MSIFEQECPIKYSLEKFNLSGGKLSPGMNNVKVSTPPIQLKGPLVALPFIRLRQNTPKFAAGSFICTYRRWKNEAQGIGAFYHGQSWSMRFYF